MADHMPIQEEARLRRRFPGAFAILSRAQPAAPMDAMEAVLPYLRETGIGPEEAVDNAAPLYANWLWQQHRVVYSIDADLFGQLARGGLRAGEDEPLPVELLRRLPFPCIAVETAHFNFRRHDSGEEMPVLFTGRFYIYAAARSLLCDAEALCVVAEAETGPGRPAIWLQYELPLVDTLEASVAALQAALARNGTDASDDDARLDIAVGVTAAQIVLYLQSVGADLQHRPGPPRKKKARGAPAQKPAKVWDVGVRIGATLRAGAARYAPAEGAGTGAPKRPHSRRGHFHSYWTGPMDGERKLVVKWTAPTFIHADAADGVAVVHRVKGEAE